MRSGTCHALLLTLCLLSCTSAGAAEPERAELTLAVASGRPTRALWLRPPDARAVLVLAPGASRDMASPFMKSLRDALVRHGEKPDPPPVLRATVRSAVREAEKRRGELPLLLGGKSLGTLVVAQVLGAAPGPVSGAVMLGYPLHAAGRPSARNAGALDPISVPMLFVQGTRDPLADISLMRAVVERLGARASLRVIEGADHHYRLPEPDKNRRAQLIDEIARSIASFASEPGPS